MNTVNSIETTIDELKRKISDNINLFKQNNERIEIICPDGKSLSSILEGLKFREDIELRLEIQGFRGENNRGGRSYGLDESYAKPYGSVKITDMKLTYSLEIHPDEIEIKRGSVIK